MILILEDNDQRIIQFKKWFPCDTDIVKTSKEAIELLKTYTPSLILLDHDLGDQIYVASGEGTGWEVAKYIAENNIKSDVVVHSCNPVGAQNMVGVLPNAHWIPFGSFTCECDIEDSKITNVIIRPVKVIGDMTESGQIGNA